MLLRPKNLKYLLYNLIKMTLRHIYIYIYPQKEECLKVILIKLYIYISPQKIYKCVKYTNVCNLYIEIFVFTCIYLFIYINIKYTLYYIYK